MIKVPTLHDTKSFDTSLPAVLRKFNVPRCTGDKTSICGTSLPFCQAGVGICAGGSTNLKAVQRLFVLQSPRPAVKNQLYTRVVHPGLTCPTLRLAAPLMALATCLCASVAITETVRGGF